MNWKQVARIMRQRWLSAVTMGELAADYAERLEHENMRLKDRLTAAMLERDAAEIDLAEAQDAYDKGYNEGLAAAFGVMGVAFAIQERERRRPREEDDASYERAMKKLRGV